MDVDDFLMHYGVKGMRWGHRRARKDLSDVKKEKLRAKLVRKNKNEIGKRFEDRLSTVTESLNKKYKDITEDDFANLTPRVQKYMEDFFAAEEKLYSDVTNEVVSEKSKGRL